MLPRVKLVCTHKAHFFKHSQTNEVVYSLARVTHKCTMALVPRPVVATCISILCRGSMLQHNTQLIFYLLHILSYLQSQAQALVLLNPLAPGASPSQHQLLLWLSDEVVQWKFLGRYLDVDETTIKRIALENQNNIREQCFQMLKAFKNQ